MTRPDQNTRRLTGLWRYGREVLPTAPVSFEGWLYQLDTMIESKAPTPLPPPPDWDGWALAVAKSLVAGNLDSHSISQTVSRIQVALIDAMRFASTVPAVRARDQARSATSTGDESER